jgi:hypothetical protein
MVGVLDAADMDAAPDIDSVRVAVLDGDDMLDPEKAFDAADAVEELDIVGELLDVPDRRGVDVLEEHELPVAVTEIDGLAIALMEPVELVLAQPVRTAVSVVDALWVRIDDEVTEAVPTEAVPVADTHRETVPVTVPVKLPFAVELDVVVALDVAQNVSV